MISPSTEATARPLRLYEIGDAYEALIQQLQENGGEVTPEIQAQLDAIDVAIEEKAEKVALHIRNLLATAKAANEEAERLASIAQTHQKAADGLKEYLKVQLKRMGLTKVETPIVRVRIQANTMTAVKWMGSPDYSDVPAPYRTEKTVYGLDRAKVLQAVEAKDVLPAGLSAERGDHLRIS